MQARASSHDIRLVIADLDGSLLDPDKKVTPEADQSVKELKERGILFTIVSGRPPFGMRMVSDLLQVKLPICGFNGGEITAPDFSLLQRLSLPDGISLEITAFLEKRKLNYWIYRGSDWMVLDKSISHCAKEARSVAFEPSVIPSFQGRLEGLTKIVAISDDHDFLARCEKEAREKFSGRVSAARSQPYYLDLTHRDANKGAFVAYLGKALGVPREQIATVGDMPSDLPMFRSCGLAIAMGNAPDLVKAQASRVSVSNSENGFAHAMREFVLSHAAPRAA